MALRPSCPALVIEDDEFFRKSLIAALDERHFTVTTTESVDAAIAILDERPFHVVIVDINLADGRSGFEVLEHIGANRDRISAQVIIVSGVDPRLREKSAVKIAAEVLLKPVDFQYVAQRASRYCEH